MEQDIFETIPFNVSAISQTKLDIDNKTRSNPLKWKGQFSPQLIEVFLNSYGKEDFIILDPFCGSGTVLYEAGRRGMKAYGTEINPAAVKLSSIYNLINSSQEERKDLIDYFNIFVKKISKQRLPLFNKKNGETDLLSFFENLGKEINTTSNLKKTIFDFLVIRSDLDEKKLLKNWSSVKRLILDLPHSEKDIFTYHADARRTSFYNDSIDLVITSPPYINVFNYHQQYRNSAEFLDYDILKIAKSEIGSNRKNRSNRFLTSIQYCLDIVQTFEELRRITKHNSRLIFVVGRESKIRGTKIHNSRILTELVTNLNGFEFILKQKREFKNQFGNNIIEDILHFRNNKTKKVKKISKDDVLNIAIPFLKKAYLNAPQKAKNDIKNAIKKSKGVQPSPILNS